MNKKKILINFLFLILLFCIIFIFLEIAFRVYIYFLNKNMYKQDLSEIYVTSPDKKYLFEHRKNINIEVVDKKVKSQVTTNNLGLRESQNYQNLQISVSFLGDSVLEGLTVNNSELMDNIFENETNLISLNFGVGAYNTYQSFEYFKDKYSEDLNTKLVIFIFCLNDIKQNSILRTFDKNSNGWKLKDDLSKNSINNIKDKNFSIRKFLKKNSFVLRIIYNFLKKNILNTKINSQYSGSAEDLKNTKEIFQNIKNWTNKNNQDLLVVIPPSLDQIKNLDSLESIHQIETLLKEINIKYFNLYEIIKNDNNPSLYHDNIHFNKKGHYIIGLEIAKFAKENFEYIY